MVAELKFVTEQPQLFGLHGDQLAAQELEGVLRRARSGVGFGTGAGLRAQVEAPHAPGGSAQAGLRRVQHARPGRAERPLVRARRAVPHVQHARAGRLARAPATLNVSTCLSLRALNGPFPRRVLCFIGSVFCRILFYWR